MVIIRSFDHLIMIILQAEGYTPLCLASSHGNSNVVKVLLEHGAHVNQQNDASIYYIII